MEVNSTPSPSCLSRDSDRSHCSDGTVAQLRDARLLSQTVISNVLPKINTPPMIASEVNFSFSQMAAIGIPKNVIK
jgi:hypothetical protein